MNDIVSVSVGDTVIVYGNGRPESEAKVTKVGRTWITVGEAWQEKRFRRDDQTDGSGYGYRSRFYTQAQWAEKQQQDAAVAFLREQGIDVRHDSPWRGRETELAATVRSATA